MLFHRVLLWGAACAAACLSLPAQSVVSVRSGVVHFFEGAVSIDGQPLEPKFGRFYDIKPGSELRTDRGRAEVLLTPGALLRVDENSSVRMVSNRLSETKVEFIGGSASLDSTNATSDAPITIAYKDYQVIVKKHGRYRFDSAPAELRVSAGEAQVIAHNKAVAVAQDQILSFDGSLTARAATSEIEKDDGLDRWSKDRSESIASANASATASDDLTASLNDPQAGGSPYDFTAAPNYGAIDPALSGYGLGYGLGYGGYLSPFSFYGAPILYGVPYRVGVYGYRPVNPIRTAPYSTWHPVGRPSSTPILRGAPSIGAHPVGGVHSVGAHPAGHR